MLNLTEAQRKHRMALLKELYTEGYRYIGATASGNMLVGKDYNFKADVFGVWGLEDAKHVDKDLFPDVKWEDEAPMVIEKELEKLRLVN
ncbi:MAG: hypothetical protein Q4E82_07680 [Peptococcaceae bacterium]|jgi:hypothetical protein|nr:hypothetical protein [Peptococcaceae bacterium]